MSVLRILESYASVYNLVPGFSLTVTVEDGKLMVQASGQAKYQVFPESKTVFFVEQWMLKSVFSKTKQEKSIN